MILNNVLGAKRLATNLQTKKNPPYTVANFFTWFPNFENQLDICIINNFIELANNNINIGKWGKNWEYGMALFIAHNCVLYAQMVGTDPDNPNPIANSSTTGLVSSESVGGASISYDTGSITNELTGWGDYKLTTYGVRFATLAKTIGWGSMLIS